MKISFRILFINFAIVAVILISSAAAFYSIMYNVLTTQQSKYLLNSVNDFVYAYREITQNADDDFTFIINNDLGKVLEQKEPLSKNIDFVLMQSGDSRGYIIKNVCKSNVYISNHQFTITDFLKNNPSAIVRTFRGNDNRMFYYGKIITADLINRLAEKIRSNIAVVWNGSPILLSNEDENQSNYYLITQAFQNLQNKNNFDVINQGSSSANLLSTIYKPDVGNNPNNQLDFVIFTTLSETQQLKTSIKSILIVIGLAGIVLSLILTLVFTDKIRKQISVLSKATEITKEGNFKTEIPIQSNDEIGQLAQTFNAMLVELEKNEKAKNEYSEFITLINKNPTLSEISEASLSKIIKTAGFVVGALYVVEDFDKITLASSYGLNERTRLSSDITFFEKVIKDKDTIEMNFEENPSKISLGIVEIEIKHLLIIPIIYNKKVIAILELGSSDKPTSEALEYLAKIKEQLAIGITNATAFVQMKNLVGELKQLNEDFQKQNIQIRKQNETLVELHNELKEKAKELEIQKSKAEEATKLKSQFLASMSHELRTPMNSILGLTELILEETSLAGKNRERLEVVLKSSKRLMNLINDILDLSKIEAGKMELHNEDVLLEELIRDVETSVSPLINNKSIDLKINRNCNTAIIVNAEREKITQVLINLLGNAIKFTEKGYVEFGISNDNNNMIRFDVKDTGIGISEENIQIIFEEFRQADGTTTRKFGGTGLGLAICKKIADLLKGSITVKSIVGKGSIFSFSVPLKFVSEKSIEEGSEVVNGKVIEQNRGPVLVIDKDPQVRMTIGQYLVSKGYEVVYADNGEKGLKMAVEIRPFAITLDVLLQSSNGWSILKELKENSATKDIPVILISIMGDRNVGYGLGAFEFFVKPASIEKLQPAFDRLENASKRRIEKIVIVDDDETEFDLFKNAFKNENIRIDYIKDSELAFSKILESQPDLVILDLIMPRLDGITLSHKLKSNIETKHIPIIISTARDLTEEEKQSLQSIVESITIKSMGHPLDVLKIVRDRLKLQENYFSSIKILPENRYNNPETPNTVSNSIPEKDYLGDALIVDDDPETLFTINEIVEACGCKTILAKNGLEALNVLEQKTPDLILMDIMMPEMDGFQAIKKIRSTPRWAQIPVFAVTAKAMIEDKEVILRHGFDDYIPKPVNPTIMSFKIKKLFSKIKTSRL
jgi:signal transduction histidine kinase/DNA-binding response OmpR family regulator/HAMP domain-containing protein